MQPSDSDSTNRSARPPGTGRRIRGLDAEQRRAQRRGQLLDAAFELIARDGYANTSIEQICQHAYVGNKAFYELFSSKEDCYLALLRQISEQVEEEVTDALANAPRDDRQATIAVISRFAHALVDDPRVAIVTFGEAAGISPAVEAQRRTNRRWSASFLESMWQRRDDIADDAVDYHAVAIATIGGLFDTIADWIHHTDPEQPRSIDKLIADLDAFVEIVRAGIAVERKRTRD